MSEAEEKARKAIGALQRKAELAKRRFAEGASPNVEGFSFAEADALLEWIEELVKDRA